MVNVDEWTLDVEDMLDKIRQNCVLLSEIHKKQFFYLQSWLKYFRLPCIVLCSINAVASIGLQAYVPQPTVSLLNCLISLVTTIITSAEMYLQIEKQMSIELDVSKDYYLLAIDIHKTLNLNKVNRNIDACTYLDSCMSLYKNLFVHSMVIEKKMKDKLTSLDCDMIMPELPGFENSACKESQDIIDNAQNSEYFIEVPVKESDKKEVLKEEELKEDELKEDDFKEDDDVIIVIQEEKVKCNEKLEFTCPPIKSTTSSTCLYECIDVSSDPFCSCIILDSSSGESV